MGPNLYSNQGDVRLNHMKMHGIDTKNNPESCRMGTKWKGFPWILFQGAPEFNMASNALKIEAPLQSIRVEHNVRNLHRNSGLLVLRPDGFEASNSPGNRSTNIWALAPWPLMWSTVTGETPWSGTNEMLGGLGHLFWSTTLSNETNPSSYTLLYRHIIWENVG